jgi:hypothetical protein
MNEKVKFILKLSLVTIIWSIREKYCAASPFNIALLEHPIYITAYFVLSHVWFHTCRLDASYYTNPLFLIGIACLTYAHYLKERDVGTKQGMGVLHCLKT